MLLRRTALVLALALTAPACSATTSGSASVEAPPAPELAVESLLDPAAVGVFRVDLAAMEHASLYDALSSTAMELAEGESSDARAFARVLLGSRSVVLALLPGAPGEGPDVVAICRGRYTRQDVDQLVGDQRSGVHLRGRFEVVEAGQDGAIALLGRHTLVFGRRPVVDAVVDRQLAGGGGSMPRGEAFRAIATAAGFEGAPIAFAVAPPEDVRAALARDPAMAAFAQAEAVGVAIDLRDGLRVRGVVALGSALAAMGAATLVRAQLPQLSADPDAVQSGLAALLPYVSVDRDGSRVVLSLDAPEGAAREAFARSRAYAEAQQEAGFSQPSP